MAYFVWASDMEIDGGHVDADHRHLVDLVNQLHTATTEGRGREVVGGILDALITYTAEHLLREETQMEAVGFPKLQAHKQGHQAFIAKLQALKAKYDGGSITVAAQLSNVLRDWLSLHIRRSDKELRDFSRANGKLRLLQKP